MDLMDPGPRDDFISFFLRFKIMPYRRLWMMPEQYGGFLQVSGLSYTIDVSVPSGCIADENGICTGMEGERRVKDVKVGEETLDPEKTYILGGFEKAVSPLSVTKILYKRDDL